MNSAGETLSARILVVDDDAKLRGLLERYLVQQGFEVATLPDGARLNATLDRARYDLVVLDLMLPGADGLSLLRELRAQRRDVPVVILTARGDEVDRIIGLEMGADDYLPKPFNPRELVARIHAILRRRQTPPPAAPAPDEGVLRFGAFTLDLARRILARGDVGVPITGGEFALLKTFAGHPRQPLSRERLMELARGREHLAFDRSIDVLVSRLRKLIEPEPARPRFIQTVWGYGYVFVPDGEGARGASAAGPENDPAV